MAEKVPTEVVEFLTRFVGATASMGEQMAFDYWWNTHPEVRDKFPYTRPHENLPMYHNFIVSGLSVAPWVIGLLVEEDAKKKGDTKTAELAKGVKQLSEGGIFYTVPRLTRITAMRSTPVPPPPAPSPAGGTPRTRTRGIVYKL